MTELSPGMVDTDMGRDTAKASGLTVDQLGGISPAKSVEGVLKVVDAVTKETHGGKFWTNEGEELSF